MAKPTQEEMRNPITGQPPNSYTQTDRDLPEPRAVRPHVVDRGRQKRLRSQALDYERSGAVHAPMGYRVDSVEPRYRTFATGARHMFPNVSAERDSPAINEPHKADPGITVQRRAEDLSGPEYRKGEDVLRQYGHDPRNPTRSLRKAQSDALDRVSAEHIAAGVHESSSQMFYGGSPTTEHLPEEHQIAHESGVMAANDRFRQAARSTAMHPDFVAATGHLPPRERTDAATRITAQAVADTSPNTKWRDVKSSGEPSVHPWPNVEQAEEAVHAAVERRSPNFISGRIQNVWKASNRVGEAIDTGDYSTHQHGDPITAPKTIAFRGALVDPHSPDAFKVSDVHEASVLAPHLTTSKAHMHARIDDTGERMGNKVAVYPDTPKSERSGLTPLSKPQGVKTIPDWGLSHPEAMLSYGRSNVHALNDRATREVLSERGLSRGVDYADNTHHLQAAAWGSQQVRRPDVNVSPADQYPVRRDWHAEGLSVPDRSHDPLRSLASGQTHDQPAPVYRRNERRGRTQSIFPEQE